MAIAVAPPSSPWPPRTPGADRFPIVRELAAPMPHRPRLLDQVRAALRLRHYSPRTEDAYVLWVRRLVLFHGKRHPFDLGEPEITAFLSNLAVERRVSASTQNQALSAILFLYKHVLDKDLDWLDGVVRAKTPPRLPVA